MMKKVAFLSATVAMLVLSGCSSKEPAIDASANAQSSTQGTASIQNGSASTDNVRMLAVRLSHR
jgi:outer membrane biogenesis lipoprotein LolB